MVFSRLSTISKIRKTLKHDINKNNLTTCFLISMLILVLVYFLAIVFSVLDECLETVMVAAVGRESKTASVADLSLISA